MVTKNLKDIMMTSIQQINLTFRHVHDGQRVKKSTLHTYPLISKCRQKELGLNLLLTLSYFRKMWAEPRRDGESCEKPLDSGNTGPILGEDLFSAVGVV
jgi:hypothetical protein